MELAADHPPPSSAVVMEELELYLYPPSGPHRACNGITLPLLQENKLHFLCVVYIHNLKKQDGKV